MNAATARVPVANQSYAFYELLVQRIAPRSQSDRTCFRNIARWLGREVQMGRLRQDAFHLALSFATEASQPGVRKPAALFVSLLKREMGYDPTQA